MGNDQIFEFKIRKEPNFISSIEWGCIGAFTVFFIEFFVIDSLKQSAAEVLYNLMWIFFILFIFASVKEVRDKKNGGIISFKKGFIVSLLTGLVAVLIELVKSYLLSGGFALDYFLADLLGIAIPLSIVSLFIALVMKR